MCAFTEIRKHFVEGFFDKRPGEVDSSREVDGGKKEGAGRRKKHF